MPKDVPIKHSGDFKLYNKEHFADKQFVLVIKPGVFAKSDDLIEYNSTFRFLVPDNGNYTVSAIGNDGYYDNGRDMSWSPETYVYLKNDKGEIVSAVKVGLQPNQLKNGSEPFQIQNTDGSIIKVASVIATYIDQDAKPQELKEVDAKMLASIALKTIQANKPHFELQGVFNKERQNASKPLLPH